MAGDRSWYRTHYLKGALRCARCGSHMGYATAKRRGGAYDYFFCHGRNSGRKDCDLPYLPVYDDEEAVARQWSTVQFTDDPIADFNNRARADLHLSAEAGNRLIADQRRRRADLERQKQKLIDAYMADALPVDDLKARQSRVAAEIADARRLTAQAQTASDEVFARLEQVIEVLTHAEQLYSRCDDQARELLNSAVFTAFRVDIGPTDGATSPVIADAPLTPPVGAVATYAGCSDKPASERTLADGSIVDQLAGQLRQRWNPNVWRPLARLLEDGMPPTPVAPRPERPPRQRQVRLAPAQIVQLIADYEAGASTTTLSKLHGVCQETVLKHLRDYGIDTRRQPKIPPEQLNEVRRLRADGWSYKRIGDRYGCSWMTVYNAIKAEK